VTLNFLVARAHEYGDWLTFGEGVLLSADQCAGGFGLGQWIGGLNSGWLIDCQEVFFVGIRCKLNASPTFMLGGKFCHSYIGQAAVASFGNELSC
jgi:hypothetical protein